MKTVKEYLNLSKSELNLVIDQDIRSTCSNRVDELNRQYLERHPGIRGVPGDIIECSEDLALHYTIGTLAASLKWVIIKLKDAEAEIEAYKQEFYHKEV